MTSNRRKPSRLVAATTRWALSFWRYILVVISATSVLTLLLLSATHDALDPPRKAHWKSHAYDAFNHRVGPSAHKNHHYFDKAQMATRRRALELVSNERIMNDLQHVIESPLHLAGSGNELAGYFAQEFEHSGLSVDVSEFEVEIGYPLNASAYILSAHKHYNEEHGEQVLVDHLELEMIEPGMPSNITTPSFYAFGVEAEVIAPVVFGYFCRAEDFDYLNRMDVNVKDAIVLCRHGHSTTELKVRYAEQAGAAAVMVYTDPAEDGHVTALPNSPFPIGALRSPHSIYRESVKSFNGGSGGSGGSGDGGDAPRIPSLPVSFSTAERLHDILDKNGPLNGAWQGSAANGQFYVGPSVAVVKLTTQFDTQKRSLRNVLGTLRAGGITTTAATTALKSKLTKNNGTTIGGSTGAVVVGAPRDELTGGSYYTASVNAVLLETARVLSNLSQAGWTPSRDIVFASLDGEQFGLLGSTQYLPKMHKAAAFVGVGGVYGSEFGVDAHPLLWPIIEHSVHRVPFGTDTLLSQSQPTEFKGESIGAHSVFQGGAGVPYLVMGFHNTLGDAVPHVNSAFDNDVWARRFGDNEGSRHAALVKATVLAILELSGGAVLPLSVPTFAEQLSLDANATLQLVNENANVLGGNDHLTPGITTLTHELHRLHKLSVPFFANARMTAQRMRDHSVWGKVKNYIRQRRLNQANEQIMQLTRRCEFYALDKTTGMGYLAFPQVVAAVREHSGDAVVAALEEAHHCVRAAADSLRYN